MNCIENGCLFYYYCCMEKAPWKGNTCSEWVLASFTREELGGKRMWDVDRVDFTINTYCKKLNFTEEEIEKIRIGVTKAIKLREKKMYMFGDELRKAWME